MKTAKPYLHDKQRKISVWNGLEEEFDNITAEGTTDEISVELILNCFKTPMVMLYLTGGDTIIAVSEIDRVIQSLKLAKIAMKRLGYV